jgi:SAM-dependent methyltransferase
LGLAIALGIKVEPLPKWTADWSRPGIGFDDAPPLFSRLPAKIIYNNTHLDRFPQLDLLNLPVLLTGSLSYAICADVLEHVPHSVDRAIRGLAELLRENGAAVISVPLVGESQSREYYPNLIDFQVVSSELVRWKSSDRNWREDKSPEFHGGTGLVLAFRSFDHDSFQHLLLANGFARSMDLPACPEFGVPQLASGGVFVAWK